MGTVVSPDVYMTPPASDTHPVWPPLTPTPCLALKRHRDCEQKCAELESTVKESVAVREALASLNQQLTEVRERHVQDLKASHQRETAQHRDLKASHQRILAQQREILALKEREHGPEKASEHETENAGLKLRRMLEQVELGLGKLPDEERTVFWTKYLGSGSPGATKMMNDFLLRVYNIKWGRVDYKERKARIEQVVKELKDLHSTLSSSVHSAWDKGLLIIEDKHSPTQVAMLQALLHLEGLEYRTRPRTDAGTAPALAPALAPAATPATAPAPAPHVVQLPQHGQRYTDDQTGRFYYYNRWSNAMQWEPP